MGYDVFWYCLVCIISSVYFVIVDGVIFLFVYFGVGFVGIYVEAQYLEIISYPN